MKAVEFKSSVAENGQISVPPEIARQIPAGEQLQVVVMWETPLSGNAGAPMVARSQTHCAC
jgi:hypothetical protein